MFCFLMYALRSEIALTALKRNRKALHCSSVYDKLQILNIYLSYEPWKRRFERAEWPFREWLVHITLCAFLYSPVSCDAFSWNEVFHHQEKANVQAIEYVIYLFNAIYKDVFGGSWYKERPNTTGVDFLVERIMSDMMNK